MGPVMSHRDKFARLVGEMDRLLREIDTLRVGRETTPELKPFDSFVEQVGARDWSGQIAANDEPIARPHVKVAESVVEWARMVAATLRGDPPPHPTPPPPSTPPPYAQAMAFGARGR